MTIFLRCSFQVVLRNLTPSTTSLISAILQLTLSTSFLISLSNSFLCWSVKAEQEYAAFEKQFYLLDCSIYQIFFMLDVMSWACFVHSCDYIDYTIFAVCDQFRNSYGTKFLNYLVMSIIIFRLLFIFHKLDICQQIFCLLHNNQQTDTKSKSQLVIIIISIIDKIKAVNQNSEYIGMRAIYKNHMGFQHLNTLQPTGQSRNPQTSNSNMNFSSSLHSGSHEYASVLSSKNIPVEDTSTKKYPNNKYYQFNDEDSSGRKFLKEKLNLYADQSFHNPQLQANQSYRDTRVPEESTRAKKAVSFSICVNDQSLINQNCQQQYKKVCKQKRQELNEKIKNKKYEEYKRFFKPKQNCNSSTIQSNKVKSSVKSYSKPKNNKKKISTSISTMETKQRKMCKSNFNSSRVIENAENQDAHLNQLKHYKKLCLNMRKKNTQLAKQLMQCKQENRKSIFELQKKIDKISEKYISKKQHNENEKTAKIMESLKSIKGKLNNKQNSEDKEAKKFYQFFIQSIDILKPDGNQNFSSLQIKVIWKQMLQYLINHNYKIGQSSKVKSLR